MCHFNDNDFRDGLWMQILRVSVSTVNKAQANDTEELVHTEVIQYHECQGYILRIICTSGDW